MNSFTISTDTCEQDIIMNENRMTTERPRWVKLGLWGLPGRAAARGFFWLSVALGIGSICYGFVDPRFWGGAAFLLAAFWYDAAIRWVDRNGSWSTASR
ncbi:hypothetical protein [Planctomicrobium piriforme]|uniref:hypothetical protein n=1 Tax=Planctomicrobium piriforme TaxID=1576369 RepID=UPI000B84A8F3|nr:hypothetical protein [Planctomicrobium piriforme]